MDDRLPPPLDRAAALLRAEPKVRAEWRDAVVLAAAAEPRLADAGRRPSRRLDIGLRSAIAAGLLCALAGGAATYAVTRPESSPATPAPTMVSIQPAPVQLPVRFNVVAPAAATVSIVGDFNDWNPTALPMRRSADGRTWEIEVRLPLGRYSYAFMIDGRLSPDPAAPRGADDDFGAPNSVLMVRGS